MKYSIRSLVAVLAVGMAVSVAPPFAEAQQGTQGPELTTADRIAMLYAPQLNFTRDGDPLIRVGLLEDRERVEFTPSEPIRLMPQGPDGPEVELPGEITYTVSRVAGQPGEYKHWVTVDRLSIDQRDAVGDVVEEWEERGYEPETFDVGGHFAVHGEVFDSRAKLVGVGGFDSRREANELRRELQAEFGIVGDLHSERLSYPSTRLKLQAEGMQFRVKHDDVLWITPRSGREEQVRYTVPDIPQSYDRGTETRTYTGELIFAPDQKGKIALINNLGAERVLKGTVPAEIFPSAPSASLKSQAIAARNEIFAAIGARNLADPFMIRADVMDQVYGGVGIENERASRAVDATRGKVMLEEGNRIVNAVYSSNAGGHTEHNENVWDAEPQHHLRGRVDAPDDQIPGEFAGGITEENLEAFLNADFDAHSKVAPVSSADNYRWNETVGVDEVQSWLNEHGESIGAIRDAEVVERGVSGRVIRLKLRGEQGETVVERELNVRRLFGGLRSGLFTMDIGHNGDGTVREFQFRGAGFGHGVGMCQTGAIGLADQGKSFRDILTHYYRGIDVHQLYE